ncbi:hypothetical protein TWF594_008479 [Orbilia oligospora]|nr:hypothetical protein TWF706_006631 [Orbilia oligospora]KAF3135089.1 hypothetical protein TWF594_008479 [Orbilia oligospora]
MHPTNLLLLSLSISTATASPSPIWNRLLTSISHYTNWADNSQSPFSPSEESVQPQPGTLVTTHLPAVTTTIYAKTSTPLPLPPAWDVHYPEEDEVEEGSEESDLEKRQDCTNSGIQNSGCGNSGNYNTGNGNSGNYNCGNGNSGNYNSGDGSAGNGGDGQCGNVVISQSVAYVYPAPSTVVVQVAPITSVVTIYQPQVYTTWVVYQQPPATTVIYQEPQVVRIVAQETYAPRGCAYWESLGYRCSAGGRVEINKGIYVIGGALFWMLVGLFMI